MAAQASLGADLDNRTASLNPLALAINVAEVTIPCAWHSTIARFTPGVKPKSSALTIRRRTKGEFSREARQGLTRVSRPHYTATKPFSELVQQSAGLCCGRFC